MPETVQDYFPEARLEDWQHVQIIKKDEKKGGVLKLSIEVVTSKYGTISALLDASTAAATGYELAETRCILQRDYTPFPAANDEAADEHDAVIGK